jgi:Domain of unknown function (DUF4326)
MPQVTAVVHCKKDPYDIYIGRPSKWGNPFKLHPSETRGETLSRYRRWVVSQPKLMADLPELIDKTLGCWCAPKPCHGDILADLVRELKVN